MIYKLLSPSIDGVQIVARIDDDGICRLTCTENDQAYLKWLEEGNTPEAADDKSNAAPAKEGDNQ